MDGLRQVGQFTTRSDDGRSHTVYAYDKSTASHGRGNPLFITNEGWEAVRVLEGVFRVHGTGLILREARTQP